MDDEDLTPKTVRQRPTDMEIMSIESLEAYIAELEAEIDRAKAAIASKQSHRKSADAFFKR